MSQATIPTIDDTRKTDWEQRYDDIHEDLKRVREENETLGQLVRAHERVHERHHTFRSTVWNWTIKQFTFVNPENVELLVNAFEAGCDESPSVGEAVQRVREYSGVYGMATAPPTRITTSLLDVPTLSALPLKPSLPVIAYATMLRKDGTAMTAKDRAIVEGQDILSVATSITVTKGKSVRSLKTAVDEESRPTKKLKTAMIPTKRVRTDDSFPQSLLDIYDQVHKTKPWTRYLRAGSILPDCDGLNAFQRYCP
ncbi:hypothetical protein DYB35_011107 [Aphanomyces astaci]|uniref:Uncharacterized protein n=1 Tax=Aphanomyces astaci TaxID=112090 RepID=A0A3R7B4P5_APHAT|nr:hypothetical protein DYB35_011107 [Aphanomyces astaci]